MGVHATMIYIFPYFHNISKMILKIKEMPTLTGLYNDLSVLLSLKSMNYTQNHSRNLQ